MGKRYGQSQCMYIASIVPLLGSRVELEVISTDLLAYTVVDLAGLKECNPSHSRHTDDPIVTVWSTPTTNAFKLCFETFQNHRSFRDSMLDGGAGLAVVGGWLDGWMDG